MNPQQKAKNTDTKNTRLSTLISEVNQLTDHWLARAPDEREPLPTQHLAIHELSKQLYLSTLHQGPIFENPDAVRGYLSSELKHLTRETFWILLLNNRHELIHSEALFKGTLNAAAVYPREVVILALEYQASAIIIAHNHPSGSCEPSRADLAITSRLKDALALIDVSVLDHFLISKNEVLSFAQHGWV